MTTKLEALSNSSRPAKRRKLLGRGPGSKHGKTCCRGQKGDGARSGWKARYGYVGGGVPLHKSTPTRGFSNVRFARKLDVINFAQIEEIYKDGEVVSLETLREKGYIKGHSNGIKVLSNGTVSKKITFRVEAFSKGAQEKLKEAGIST